jgi:polar amino acid transport system substrate-binding protein
MRSTVYVFALFFLGLHVSAESISIRSDEWYPINGDPASEKPGYMIEIAQHILNKHNYTLDYQIMPWERSITEVRRGSHDCIVGTDRDEVPDFIFPSRPWGEAGFKVYVKESSPWIYTGLDSLKSIRMGVIGGYAYSEDIDNYILQSQEAKKNRNAKGNSLLPDIHPHAVQITKGNNALEQNIKKLLNNRIDALIASPLIMSVKLKSMNIANQIKTASDPNSTTPIYIACSPAKDSSKKITQWFSSGIDEMRSSGELATILKKYAIKDWKKTAQ